MAKRASRRRTSPAKSDQRPTGREVIGFIEKFLRIPDGPCAGQPLILAPWQKHEIHTIYDSSNGCRRHIISTARKNSKTTLCAALLLNHLCGPSARGRPNTRLYSSAQSRDQAALTFDQARKMVLWNADLRQIISVKESTKFLRYDELGIEYRALSAEANTAQGLNPSLHICDELGQVVGPHSALFEALELATAAQWDPLTVVISTQSASDADLLSTLIDDGLGGLDSHNSVSLYAAAPELDPFGEEAIRAANPSLDLFMNKAEILAMASAARRLPAREAAYRRYTLNQRIEVATPFVSPSLWESCRGQVAPLDELSLVYAGLDLSAVSDLSAFVLVGQQGDKWHTHCRFWLPQDGLIEKAAADHAPYDVWCRQGHLQTTPGRTIDYDYVAQELRDLFRRHNIQQVAYDPWNWDFFKPSLLRAGFTESVIADHFQEFAQTTKMMSPALANLERLLLDGRLVHGNPILSMCVAHTTIRTDAAGNRAPDKRKSTHRIDGTVALVMGLAIAPTAQAPAFDPCALIG
jgi:phage terminase large subunit-like protein